MPAAAAESPAEPLAAVDAGQPTLAAPAHDALPAGSSSVAPAPTPAPLPRPTAAAAAPLAHPAVETTSTEAASAPQRPETGRLVLVAVTLICPAADRGRRRVAR
jgi:hypothetical protein